MTKQSIIILAFFTSFICKSQVYFSEASSSERILPGIPIDIGFHSRPCFIDLDKDGDLDIVSGEEGYPFIYIENINGNYIIQDAASNPFSALSARSSTPTFADLDLDGDLDLFSGDREGTMNYFENINGVYTKSTALGSLFSTKDYGSYTAPSFIDWDNDNDLDMIISSYSQVFYYENIFGVFTEKTGSANPFDNVTTNSFSALAFVDIDNDNDLDVVRGFYDAFQLYQNDGGALTMLTGAANPFDGIHVGRWSAPAFADLDGDNDMDLISGENYGKLLYFRNDTGNYNQIFGAKNPFDGVISANYSSPVFFDYDGDTDLDFFSGNSVGTIKMFKEENDSIEEILDSINPFIGLDFGQNSTITFVNFDQDNHVDAIIGSQTGTLRYFHNDGTSYTEKLNQDNPFDTIDVGSNSKASFVDLDLDGDLDLICGAYDGNFHYFQNTNSVFIEKVLTDNPLSGLNVGSRSAPIFVDLDKDGDQDLVSGCNDGVFYYFENSGGIYTEKNGSSNPFDGFDVGFTSIPDFVDLDGDLDLDLVSGGSTGQFTEFHNKSLITSINKDFSVTLNNVKLYLNVFPNPNYGSFVVHSSQQGKAKIFDMMGGVVWEGQLNEGVNHIELGINNNGVFLIKCLEATTKLIVK